jgi:hypothetical protein
MWRLLVCGFGVNRGHSGKASVVMVLSERLRSGRSAPSRTLREKVFEKKLTFAAVQGSAAT